MKRLVTAGATIAFLVCAVTLSFGDEPNQENSAAAKSQRVTIVTQWKAEKVNTPEGGTRLRIFVDQSTKLDKAERYVLSGEPIVLIRGGGVKVSGPDNDSTLEVVPVPPDLMRTQGLASDNWCHMVVQGSGSYCTGGCDAGKYCLMVSIGGGRMCGCNKWL